MWLVMEWGGAILSQEEESEITQLFLSGRKTVGTLRALHIFQAIFSWLEAIVCHPFNWTGLNFTLYPQILCLLKCLILRGLWKFTRNKSSICVWRWHIYMHVGFVQEQQKNQIKKSKQSKWCLLKGLSNVLMFPLTVVCTLKRLVFGWISNCMTQGKLEFSDSNSPGL